MCTRVRIFVGGIMSKNMSKRVSIVFVAVLLTMVVCASSISLATSDIALADSNQTMQVVDSLIVGHISDIHYFPLAHCYPNVHADNYLTSDFYHSMTGDTKLVLESGLILAKHIQDMIADAKAGKDMPMYLIASGDLCKNGEHAALIDVANSLRYLQNEMRKIDGYENFQVFASPGNHDLYNHDGALYSQIDGSESIADTLNSAQFALVFAGLGYPDANLTGEGGAIKLTDYLPEEYWSTSYTDGYQTSTNATNIKYSYYSEELNAVQDATTSDAKLAKYIAMGDTLHRLTFVASIEGEHSGYSFIAFDPTDRKFLDESEGSLVRVSQLEFENLSGNYKYYLYDETNGVILYDTPLKKGDVEGAIDAGKAVFRSTGITHYTGGRITQDCLDWAQSIVSQENGDDGLNEETIISSVHQNVLPHWEKEDEILKDFTLFNCEYVANRLLGMGSRYVLTGHMHASDIECYTDIEGRTLYDFQTGSCVSYSSPRRYLTITRANCDGKLAEIAESTVHSVTSIKEVASDNVFSAPKWNQTAFETANTAYSANPTPQNWQAVLDSNPEYLTYIVRYAELSTLSLNEFMSKDVYSILLDRMISHFANEELLNSLKDMVSDLLLNLTGMPNMIVGALGFNGTCLNGAAQYLIDTILYNLYPDTDNDGKANYPLNGESYDTALDYVLAIVNGVLDFSYGDDSIASSVNPTNAGKLDVRQIASFIMTSHSIGCEVSFDETYASIDALYTEEACGDDHYAYMLPTDKTYRKRMLAALKDMDEQLKSGKFVQDLLDALLNPLFINDDSLLKTLFEYDFDFSKAVDEDYLTETDYQKLKAGLAGIVEKIQTPLIQTLLGNLGIELTLPEDFTIDADNFELKSIINTLLPAIKPIVGDLFGFNFEGDDIFTIVQGLLDGYLTESFYVGIGGIAGDIVIAFATDVMPDLADNTDPSKPLTLQPYAEYKYANQKVSYLSTLNSVSSTDNVHNPATQENGRLPSHVVSHFNTDDTTGGYSIKFYTREDVYGTFKLYDENGTLILEASTTLENALSDYESSPTNFLNTTASATNGNVRANLFTQTKPQYVPLIDLGLLALTHAEIDYETEDGEVKFKWGERDNAAANSVIYWNVTTVTVTGLEPNTQYYYDVLGNYQVSGEDELTFFSLADLNENGEYFSIKTSPMASSDEFSFLAIADIQGMIQSMYDDSYKAVNALLNDARTKDFDFILNAGDMCDNGKNFNQWGMALNTYKDLFANSSLIFTEGNHEGGSGSMTNFFNYYREQEEDATEFDELSTEEEIVYYSFDYANSHFVVLNTNDADGNGLGEDQLAWLEQDLASAQNAKWRFVLMHKSLFSGGSHSYDAEVVAMRAQLVPIFANNNVNIVFAGHDHVYTTTTLINADGVATSELKDTVNYTGDGVMYITLGTMGTKFYNYGENENVTPNFDANASLLETLTTQTFGKVVVSGDTITYTGYTYDATNDAIVLIDETVLTDVEQSNLKTIITAVVLTVLGVGLATTITLVALKTNGKLGKKKVATNAQDTPVDQPTQEIE